MQGQVIGINTAIYSPNGGSVGIGFAIPSAMAQPIVAQLRDQGEVQRGWLGVEIQDLNADAAESLGLPDANGALVATVAPDSPAAKAGLKTGDVITQLNGQPVSDAGELQVQVGQKEPGTTIQLGIIRDGKNVNVPVTLQSMNAQDSEDEAASSEHGKPRWGLGLSDMTPDLREQLQAPKDLQGAVVGRVQPGSPADNAGIGQGDVILEINRNKVQSASDAVRELQKIEKGQDALVLVWSSGGNTFRVLHPTQG